MTASTELTPEFLARFEDTVNAEIDPIVYLSIDPGNSNGICGYTVKGYLQFMFTVKYEQFGAFLDLFKHVTHLVLEDYKVYPGKQDQHIYSDLKTTQMIGIAKDWARRNKVELILQMAHIKPTAYAWLGKKPLPKSDPMNHALDAHAHFTYWGVRKGVIDARSLVRKPR